jgi:hypothetical protein
VTSGGNVTGTVVLQHNLAKYTATSSVNLNYTSGCVHPSSGSITTTFSGTQTGTETLNFNLSTCGQASLIGTGGSTSTVTLGHIF